jgi:hypothetical protein
MGAKLRKLWILHDPHGRGNLVPAQPEQVKECLSELVDSFSSAEPVTLVSLPLVQVRFEPGDSDPFTVLDLNISGPSVTKVRHLDVAERLARATIKRRSA